MNQVKFLSMDAVQGVEKTKETSSYSNKENGSNGFANLVEEQIDQQNSSDRKSAYDKQNKSGNEAATHHVNKTNNQHDTNAKDKTVTAANMSNDSDTTQGTEVDHEVTNSSIDANDNHESDANKSAKPLAQDTQTEQDEASESQALLSMLAASGELLNEKAFNKQSNTDANKVTASETKPSIYIQGLINSSDKSKQSGELDSTDGETSESKLATKESAVLEAASSGKNSAKGQEALLKSVNAAFEGENETLEGAALRQTVAKDKFSEQEVVTQLKDALKDKLGQKATSGDSITLAENKQGLSKDLLSNTSSQTSATNDAQTLEAEQLLDGEVIKADLTFSKSSSAEFGIKDEQKSLKEAIKQASNASTNVLDKASSELASEAKTNVGNSVSIEKAAFDSVKGAEPNKAVQVNQSTAKITEETFTQGNDDGAEQQMSDKEQAKSLANAAIASDAEKQAQKQDSSTVRVLQAESVVPRHIMAGTPLAEQQAIDDFASEQMVNQVANRVVRENVQMQKAQVALDTISIYRKDFANEVKEKVMVMINQKLQQVEIQLDPPELGNVHVRVNLQSEQASVSFMVQNQQAKDALEQHMGKLRDMLADSGVDVGDANVHQEKNGSDQEQKGYAGQGEGETMSDDIAMESTLNANVVKASAVGVDFYA